MLTMLGKPSRRAAKRITPSRFQVPGMVRVVSASGVAGPPVTLILFSFPSAKKARYRLSGDQKGDVGVFSNRAKTAPSTHRSAGYLSQFCLRSVQRKQ